MTNNTNFTNFLKSFSKSFLAGKNVLHFEVITGEDDDGCNLVFLLVLLSNSSFSGMVLAIVIERDDEELLLCSSLPGNGNRVGGVSSVA